MADGTAEFVKNWLVHVDIPRMLENAGEDLGREGLAETPRRVGAAWKEFLEGYHMNPEDILDKTFEAEGTGLQISSNIVFTSLCEHHLLAFHGTATIAYIPDKRVCGLSKLARLVDCFSRRLQIQERMTQQIQDALCEHLKPHAAIVIVHAKHLCCVGRGIKRDGMNFTTAAAAGEINNPLIATLLGKEL